MMNSTVLIEPPAIPKPRRRKFLGIRLRYWKWFLVGMLVVFARFLAVQFIFSMDGPIKTPPRLSGWLISIDLIVSVLIVFGIVAFLAYLEQKALSRMSIDTDLAYDQNIFYAVQSRNINVAGSAENVQRRVVEALSEYGVLIVKRDDSAGQTTALTPQCWRSFGDRIKISLNGSDPCNVLIQVSARFYPFRWMTNFGRSWEHVDVLSALINMEARTISAYPGESTAIDLKDAANIPPAIFLAGAWQRLLVHALMYAPTLVFMRMPGKAGTVAVVFVVALCIELFVYLKFRSQVRNKLRTELQESFEVVLTNFWALLLVFAAALDISKSWHETQNLIAVSLFGVIVFNAWSRLKVKKGERAQRTVLLADREKAELERQLSDAKLVALSAQIEPHFLFNTLASIQYLIRNDTNKAGEMTSDLIRYLRLALPRMKQSTARLADELELVRAYLGIMQIRMGARLQFTIDSPDDLSDVQIPTMTLITLVENAIKHGLEQKPNGGTINLAASRDAYDPLNLRLEVADTGGGFSTAASGTGIGLANIRERLNTLYGNRARLELEANQPSGVKAILIIPIERK
jgi:two-component sensor histidine kinase